jgi:hypothetical protein
MDHPLGPAKIHLTSGGMIMRGVSSEAVSTRINCSVIVLFSILFLTSFLIIPASAQSESPDRYPAADITALTSSLNPKILLHEGDESQGRFQISDECWWMFFLHVRPLEGAPELNLDVPRDLIISFWQNMAVTSELTGKEGTFLLDDREAYWVEAMLLSGMVRTRFIVWDDVMSGRRYIGDININVARETPDSLLLIVQDAMIQVAGGNADKVSNLNTMLPKQMDFDDLGLSIRYPENTRAARYHGFDTVKPENVPAEQWGTIWVLPHAANWRYDLIWSDNDLQDLMSWLNAEFPNLLRDEANHLADAYVDSLTMIQHSVSNISGSVMNKIKFGEQEYPEWLKFVASEWTEGGIKYRAVVAAEEYDDMWGNYFDGSVSDETMKLRMQEWLDCVK